MPIAYQRLLLVLVLAGHAMLVHAARDTIGEIEAAGADDPARLLNSAQQQLSEAQASGDKTRQLAALRRLSVANRQLDDYARATVESEQGKALGEELHDPQAVVHFLLIQADITAVMGREEEGEKLCAAALALATRHGLSDSLGWIYRSQGLLRREQSAEALALLHRAHSLFDAQQERLGMSYALNGIGVILSVAGRSDKQSLLKAIDYFQRALVEIDPHRHRSYAADSYHNLGRALYRNQEWERAKLQFEHSRRLGLSLKNEVQVAAANLSLAEVAVEQGLDEQALQYVEPALDVFTKRGQSLGPYLLRAHLVRADTLARLGRREESVAALASAESLVKRTGSPVLTARYHETATRVHTRFKQYELALQQLHLVREAEKRALEQNNSRLAKELQVRFEVRQKENENALLRAEQREAQARRWVFNLTLILGLVLLAGLILYVLRQQQQQRRLAELRLEAEKARQAAVAANIAKSRFLATASHDLRQPMHALDLYLGFITNCELPEEARPSLASARLCAQTMDEMFRALLDISRLDSGTVQPNLCVFPVASVLDQVQTQFAPQAEEKGLALRVVRSSAYVRSDPAMVVRIICNFISNAVRYTQQGKVVVGCRRKGGLLRIAVHDTGPGIAPDQQRAVFDEFFQLGNPERDRAKGLGLGLAIVDRLAKLLGAPLVLASQPGMGSMFAVDLPFALSVAAPARAVAPAAARTESTAAATADNPLSGTLVVVVDDEPHILDATRTVLEQWGCGVITAASGREALARLADSARVPDALICDYRLRGDENGIDVVVALRNEFNEDIPALLITGDTAAERIREITASGLALVHKPIEPEDLKQALHLMIGIRNTN